MTNPQAFPVSTIDGFTNEGMTLRDWFAGQALVEVSSLISVSQPGTFNEVARLSYALADAMLAARSAKP